MYSHPEALRILSAEIHQGRLAEAEHRRQVKVARQARRARGRHIGRRHQDTGSDR
jgi:hypothetical protein